MRLTFLLLLLANLVLFAYIYVVGEPRGVDRQIPLLQISPEKIKIISPRREAAPSAKARPQAAAKAAAPAVCLEWGVFFGPELARADAALTGLGVPESAVHRETSDAGAWWVHFPPFRTRADVDRKIAELKALGITEFFVVQDGGQWRNAISLGIFKTEEAARSHLAALQAKGVKTATIGQRANLVKQGVVLIRDPSTEIVARLTELKQEFPGSEMRAVACPPALATTG